MTTSDGWTTLSLHDVDHQTDALLGPMTQDIYALETSRNELSVPRPVVSALNLARAIMGQCMVKRQARGKGLVRALVKPDVRDNALFCADAITRVQKFDSLMDTIHLPLFERALSVIACIHAEVDSLVQLSLPVQSMLIKKETRDLDSRFTKNPEVPNALVFTYSGGVGMTILLPLKSGPLCYLFHAAHNGEYTCAISNNALVQLVWFEQFRRGSRRDAGTPFLAYILQHKVCSRGDFRTKDADAETQRLLDISLDILDSEKELEKWRPVHEGYCRLDQPECQQCRRIFLRLPPLPNRNRPLPEVPSSASCSSGTGETCVRTPAPKRENSVSVDRVSQEKMAWVKSWRKKTFQILKSAAEREGYWHELDPGSDSD
ncbi:uncharacterized protein BT62DRAFT_921750 [Guyanagaster necrorhizus]|uniref:Uncharacterized protein n=1 Tax=Guyanagaster necrorhizus TaxID=856835 RepID=A0A9P7VN16_9AGAR|nr:uncharacterized protein BT62DRAFT_921750 [Guyanagaster necrorhizus MCA 3950]KAG7443543.1 hypothetical protein BT62DRAFT_921750 [Guyanagaster necrorhizus MCA 3950]